MISNEKLIHYTKVAILAVSIVIGLSFVQAWTGPLSTPPNCISGNPGCDAPINVSNNPQTKIGDLTLFNLYLGGDLGIGTVSPTERVDVVGFVKGRTGLCIGNDCRTAWPAGGGSGGPSLTPPGSACGPGEVITWNGSAFVCVASVANATNANTAATANALVNGASCAATGPSNFLPAAPHMRVIGSSQRACVSDFYQCVNGTWERLGDVVTC